MKTFTKLVYLLIAAALMASLIGCGAETQEGTETAPMEEPAATEAQPTAEEEMPAEEPEPITLRYANWTWAPKKKTISSDRWCRRI